MILEGVPFTQVANCVLNDSSLSLGAKGMFAYIASKPPGWDFSSERITSDTSDGLRSVQSVLKELEASGYLKRVKMPSGKVQYELTFTKSLYAESAESQNSILLKAQSAELGSISNKENIIINNINNKDIIPSSPKPQKVTKKSKDSDENLTKINFVFGLMRKINPTVHSVIAHKVQRDSCVTLIDTFGPDEVQKRINLIPTLTDEYAPRISTPQELYVKWSKLDRFIKENNRTVKVHML